MRALLLAVVLAGVLASGPVTVVGKVKSWSCIGPCCCTIVDGRAGGQTYSARVCRWFRPFVKGELISKTGRPNAAGLIW